MIVAKKEKVFLPVCILPSSAMVEVPLDKDTTAAGVVEYCLDSTSSFTPDYHHRTNSNAGQDRCQSPNANFVDPVAGNGGTEWWTLVADFKGYEKRFGADERLYQLIRKHILLGENVEGVRFYLQKKKKRYSLSNAPSTSTLASNINSSNSNINNTLPRNHDSTICRSSGGSRDVLNGSFYYQNEKNSPSNNNLNSYSATNDPNASKPNHSSKRRKNHQRLTIDGYYSDSEITWGKNRQQRRNQYAEFYQIEYQQDLAVQQPQQQRGKLDNMGNVQSSTVPPGVGGHIYREQAPPTRKITIAENSPATEMSYSSLPYPSLNPHPPQQPPNFNTMNYAELVNYAEEQRQRINSNTSAIQNKEAKLRILTQNYNQRVQNQSEERVRVDQIRKEVDRDAKELARLRKIQVELENQRATNLGAKSELDNLHQIFSSKERELRSAVSKVSTLKTQLEQIQIRRQSAANAAMAVAQKAAKEKRISDDRKLLAERQRELSHTDQRIHELMQQLKHQQQQNDPSIHLINQQQLQQQQNQQLNRPKAAIEPFHVTPPNSRNGSLITVNLKPQVNESNNNDGGSPEATHLNAGITGAASPYKGGDFASAFSAVQNLPPPSSHHHTVSNGYMTPPPTNDGSSPTNSAQIYATPKTQQQQQNADRETTDNMTPPQQNQYASKSHILQNAYIGKGRPSPPQHHPTNNVDHRSSSSSPSTSSSTSPPSTSKQTQQYNHQRNSISSSSDSGSSSGSSATTVNSDAIPSSANHSYTSGLVNFRRRPVLLQPTVLEPTPENRHQHQSSSNTTTNTTAGSLGQSSSTIGEGAETTVPPDLIPVTDHAVNNDQASSSVGIEGTHRTGMVGSTPPKEHSATPSGTPNKYDQVETDIVHIRLNNIRAAKRRSWAQGASSNFLGDEGSKGNNKSPSNDQSPQQANHQLGAERDHIQMMLKREQEKGRSNINLSWIFDKAASSQNNNGAGETKLPSTLSRPTSLIITPKTNIDKRKAASPLHGGQASSPAEKAQLKSSGSSNSEQGTPQNNVRLEDGSLIRPPPPYSLHRSSAEEEEDDNTNSSSEPSAASEASPLETNQQQQPKILILPTPEKGILKRGPRKEKRNIEFDPLALLLDAALEGELDLVKRSAQRMSNEVSECNDEGITALHNAICAGHYEIVRFLVEAGADVNAADSDGWTPLHCAASCNNLPMVKFLVERGSCVFATTVSDHETPADKCEEDEDGFHGCHQFLVGIQEKMGYMHDARVYCGYSYDGNRPDELTVHEGEPLIVRNRSDDSPEDQWWLCRKILKSGDKDEGKGYIPAAENGGTVEGYIPRNYLSLYPRIKHQQYLPAGVNLSVQNASDQADSSALMVSTNSGTSSLPQTRPSLLLNGGKNSLSLDEEVMEEEIQSLCLDEVPTAAGRNQKLKIDDCREDNNNNNNGDDMGNKDVLNDENNRLHGIRKFTVHKNADTAHSNRNSIKDEF